MDTPFKIVYFTQPEVYPFSSEISFFTVHFLAILLVQDPGFVQVEFIDQFACWSLIILSIERINPFTS